MGQQRQIVNSGTSTYEVGPLREFQRSTSAHNTVVIDGRNSSEVWGSFRVGDRAEVCAIEISHSESEIIVQASHDGYNDKTLGQLHTRRWVLSNGSLKVVDSISGSYSIATANFYFAPESSIRWASSGSNLRLRESRWYCRFGEESKNSRLSVDIENGVVSTEFMWN